MHLEVDLKVAGMGTATLDYLALVKKYPKPDEKLRALKSEVNKNQHHHHHHLIK